MPNPLGYTKPFGYTPGKETMSNGPESVIGGSICENPIQDATQNKARQNVDVKEKADSKKNLNDAIKVNNMPDNETRSVVAGIGHMGSAGTSVGGHAFSVMSGTETDKEQAAHNKDLSKLSKLIRLHFQTYQQPPPTTSQFYRIGRVLGKGAFGKVSLAMHKLSEQLVAIKSMVKETLQNQKDLRRRTELELGILKQCNHKNVVRLYDQFETNKHICFVIELCSGGDLFSYIKKRRRLKEEVARYFFK